MRADRVFPVVAMVSTGVLLGAIAARIQRNRAGTQKAVGSIADAWTRHGRLGDAVQVTNELYEGCSPSDSQACWDAWANLYGDVQHARSPGPSGKSDKYPWADQYKSGTSSQIGLFELAAELVGVSPSWARDPSLHRLLKKESLDGVVGIPNYLYGSRVKSESGWKSILDDLRAGKITSSSGPSGPSSATGLGQMTLTNINNGAYLGGRAGIGVALDEAAGMLNYIKKRYGTPKKALEFHLDHNWY